MYYLLLIAATVLFSIQFVFNKMFEREVGATFLDSCAFLALESLIFGIMLFIYDGCHVEMTPYSLLMALLNTGICIGSGYFSIVALSISDLAKYSLYMMLGGMAIPFVYGFLFHGDQVTWQKLVCFVTIAAALYINARGGEQKKGGWRAWLCYIAIFVFNGLSGVISTMHQNPAPGVEIVSTNDFSILTLAVNILITGGVLLAHRLRGGSLPRAREGKSNLRAFLAAGGYGVVNGIASVLVLLSIVHIEPSVQYPIITGGCVVLSVVFGLFFHEKITRKNAVCALVTLVGTLLLMVP